MAIDPVRLKQLFQGAVAIADREQRAAWLVQECGSDAELLGKLKALLIARDDPESFLDRLAAPASANTDETGAFTPQQNPAESVPLPASEEKPGHVVGRYKLLECIGEGGMGSVWMAEQRAKPVKRLVALKLIKAGMDSKAVLTRFEAERQALALMDHPNIAKVLDGGTTDSRRPYFVMELVKGLPLTEYCDSRKLNVKDRLQLFLQICAAVQHAHQKGIIHRDLKPGNVIVTEHDGVPVPKVIDFGLAKALSASNMLTDRTLHTAYGTVVGTPLYMAPEQVGINALDTDTRSDIYALGVMLYELLTGTTPLEKQRFKEAAWEEVKRIIQDEEPPRPSMRLSTSEALPSLAANRQIEPARLSNLIKGELDWIVMKALEKDRNRRYETANGFSRDIQRYLADEVVEARPPSARYRLRKFVQRNKGKVIAAGIMLGLLLAGIAGTTFGLIKATQSAELERLAKIEAQDEKAKAVQAADAERQARQREVDQRTRAEKARDRTRDVLDAMTSVATGDSLSSQKEISAEQKKFLTEVLTYYREFAGEKADNEQSRARTAKAAQRVGLIECRLGRNEQGFAAFQMARDGYRRLAADFPTVPTYRQELARSNNHLGLVLADLGKQAEAEEQHRNALALLKSLTAEFPNVPDFRHELANSRNNLGTLLVELGKLGEAEEQYRQALAIQEKLAAEFLTLPDYRHKLANSRNNLGILLNDLGKRVEAEEQHRQALGIRKTLTADFPTVPTYRYELACSHINLGLVLADLGKQAEAEEQYRNALALLKNLAAEFPVVPDYRQLLANGHSNLGAHLAKRGNQAEAEDQHRRALAIRKTLAADFPTVPTYRQELATSHNNLGMTLAYLGQRAEAEELCRRALAIRETLVADFPTVPGYRIDLGVSYASYGRLIRDDRRSGDSLGWFDKSIATLALVHRGEPRGLTAKKFLRNSYLGRALAYDALTRPAEAIKDWDRAVELSPPAEQSGPRARRATSRLKAGQVAEAVAEVAELTKPGANASGSEKWNAIQWYDFACVYSVASTKIADKKQEYADRAMELLQKAVKAGYKDAVHMAKDTDLDPLRGREDFKKLMAELEKGAQKK